VSKRDKRNHPDEVHQCKRRMIAHQYAEHGYPPNMGAIALSFMPKPAGKSTWLLMYCDGCGTYSTITVPGAWDLADLDPAFPAAG
jgi:hypothetical protein